MRVSSPTELDSKHAEYRTSMARMPATCYKGRTVGRERIPHSDSATIPTGPPGGRMPVRAWKSPPLRRRSGPSVITVTL